MEDNKACVISYCSKCKLMYTREFDISDIHGKSVEDKLICPKCGEKTSICIPSVMKPIVRSLVQKGYDIVNIYPEQIGVEISPQVNNDKPLPENYEITNDPASNTSIIYNKAILDSKAENSSEEMMKLFPWCRSLSTIGEGGIVDFVSEEDDNNDEE